MRKLATIRIIRGTQPMPKADNIELVFVDGWQCVAKKGEFQVLDKCVYFEIDSILPVCPLFEFMEKRKFKVKTIKCMKQLSQGLALPYSIMNGFSKEAFKAGDDVTDIIGVTKIDADGDKIQTERTRASYPWWKRLMLRFKWTRNIVKSWERKSTFPSNIVSKTDEERWQNLSLSRRNYLDKVLEITEKLDGQSATYIYRPNVFKEEFIVCSRNRRLEKPDNSSWWTVAKEYKILEALRKIHSSMGIGKKAYVILQGEILGTAIQKNKYKVKGYEFYVFNLKTSDMIGTTQLTYNKTRDALSEIRPVIKQVPEVAYAKITSIEMINGYIEEFGCFRSKRNPDMWAEGIVVRCEDEQSLSFKYINPKFLLKYDD